MTDRKPRPHLIDSIFECEISGPVAEAAAVLSTLAHNLGKLEGWTTAGVVVVESDVTDDHAVAEGQDNASCSVGYGHPVDR